MKKIHEKISEICTTLKLRKDFGIETGLHWMNVQNEPEIDYVYWLEAKVLEYQKDEK